MILFNVDTVTAAMFSAADYLQLAAVARRTLRVEIDGLGYIDVIGGVIQKAVDSEGSGFEAAVRILIRGGLDDQRVCRCHSIAPLTITGIGASVQEVLLEATKRLDEGQTSLPVSNGQQSIQIVRPPRRVRGKDKVAKVNDIVERGVEAMLRREYADALAAFLQARALGDDSNFVAGNIKRLTQLVDQS